MLACSSSWFPPKLNLLLLLKPKFLLDAIPNSWWFLFQLERAIPDEKMLK